MAKKIWQKPELIVITRSRPEESVLGICKFQGALIGPSSVPPCEAVSGIPACRGNAKS